MATGQIKRSDRFAQATGDVPASLTLVSGEIGMPSECMNMYHLHHCTPLALRAGWRVLLY